MKNINMEVQNEKTGCKGLACPEPVKRKGFNNFNKIFTNLLREQDSYAIVPFSTLEMINKAGTP